MRFVTAAEVLQINGKILGGQPALRERGLLESAVARPQMSVFGQDAYPTLVEKAAALLHSLVLNHPFVDGNKRTATLAMILFLNWNGRIETWTEDAAFEFIIAVAEGKHDVPAIAAWLTTHTAPLTS